MRYSSQRNIRIALSIESGYSRGTRMRMRLHVCDMGGESPRDRRPLIESVGDSGKYRKHTDPSTDS
jgi:hypothetical protein